MLIGAKLPHTGSISAIDAPNGAVELESAGFDSIWVSDHVVMPEHIESWYPLAVDGRATWPTDMPYLEAITMLAAAAAVTSTVRLGTAALVLPQRNPVLTAKQLGTVAALSGGRLDLGVTAGWLREEFDALDAPFDDRGSRIEQWVDILRDVWTGRPAARSDGYSMPAGILALPTPPTPIPVLLGGHSPRALRRVGRLGDGWLPQQSLVDVDPDRLAADLTVIDHAARTAGRDPAQLRCVLRVVGSLGRHQELASRLAELADAGVTEVIVDVDLAADPAGVRAELAAGVRAR